MAEAAIIYLIEEIASAHGVHEQITEERRLILCTKKSVRQSEYYTARNTGYMPELMFVLTIAADYHGESRLEYDGKGYDIIRTHETKSGGLEIIVEREDMNEPN